MAPRPFGCKPLRLADVGRAAQWHELAGVNTVLCQAAVQVAYSTEVSSAQHVLIVIV